VFFGVVISSLLLSIFTGWPEPTKYHSQADLAYHFLSVRKTAQPTTGIAKLLLYNRFVMQGIPGAELIGKGLADLARNEETVESLLVSIGSPRLRTLGVPLAAAFDNPEHRLYELLGRAHGDNAHGQYNALVRLLVSYERALACARP